MDPKKKTILEIVVLVAVIAVAVASAIYFVNNFVTTPHSGS